MATSEHAAPTIEAWCQALIETTDPASKLRPGPPPDPRDPRSWETAPPARRIAAPGRPSILRVARRSPKTPSPGALVRADVRARVMHTFLHHELQAAELFAWAVLAFPHTPRAFRVGLVQLCREELAHLDLYRSHLGSLGFAVGDFPVRDWFWTRVARCEDERAFVALQGLGLEGANLEHAPRFADAFRAAGDERGAEVLESVAEEEIAHVAFARKWFERFTGAPLDYDAWRDALPAPLTPSILQGRPLNRSSRLRAGLAPEFLTRLEAEPRAEAAGDSR